MSEIDHTRDCVLPSDGRAEGLVKASEFFALAAERDALRAEVERLKGNMRARLADHINGTPCAEIRWQQERETLTAEVERLTGIVDGFSLDPDFIRLTARVKELEGQHKGLVLQNALLRQRPDLPVDRIPAAKEVEALTARVKELEAALEIMSMMGGYTKFHPDETAPGVEQNTYSWGVSDGYKEMAEMARAVLSASQPAPSPWRPTHRHVKRGSTYQVIGEAELQATDPVCEGTVLTVYKAEDGKLWVRPTYEFKDGRFETLPPAPSPRDGFDAIPISNLRACASDKCKNVAAYKMEFFNVGANYCQQCAERIAGMLSIPLPPAPQKEGE